MQRLNTTLENFPGGICMFNKDFVMTVANRGHYEIIQLDKHWFPVGSTLPDIFCFHASRGDYGDGDVDEIVARMLADVKVNMDKKYRVTRPQDGATLEFTHTPLEGATIS